MAIYWHCTCYGTPAWAQKNETCATCGAARKTIKDLDYTIQVRLANQRKLKKKYKGLTLTRVQKIEREMLAEISKGTFIDVKGSGYERLKDLIEKYRTKIRVDKPGYLPVLKKYLERMEDFFGNPKFTALTKEWIEDWKLDLRGTVGLAEATVDRHITCGLTIWNYCIPDLPNPWKRVTLYHPKNELVRFLSEEQEEKVLEHAYAHYRHLFEILIVSITTGLRQTNVYTLMRSQVNWDTGFIMVKQKGGGTHHAVLTDICRGILSKIPDNGTPYFWVSSKQGKNYGKPHTNLRKSYTACLEAAGVDPKGFRWHDLRHHAATKVVRKLGLLGAKEFLGHTDIRHTLRYAHLENQARVQALNEIGIQLPEKAREEITKVIPLRKKVG